jgi:hypothetical protein
MAIMKCTSLAAVVLGLLLTPAVGFAQGTGTFIGSVVDASKAVLPGVTITVTDVSTGRPYQAVSDSRGEYVVSNVVAGRYKLQAELSGFGTVVYPNVEMLVGQNITVQFTMQVAAVQETLTVTGQTPLVDTSSASVAGNVDRQEMANMPLAGRNWLELSMLVKGVTANDVTPNSPGVGTPDQFQLNLDGQQISSRIGTVGYGAQPKLSRDAVAEFQIVTNMFDITQGRSLGLQVNAISKSGSNIFSGSAYDYFRGASLNAADFVTHTVLNYSDNQSGGSFGGPIVRDKLLFFASYEYERNPFTIFTAPPQMPGETFSIPDTQTTNLALGRVDWQADKNNHATVRWDGHDFVDPYGSLTGTTFPSLATNTNLRSQNLLGSWTRVLGNNLVTEVRGGLNRVYFGYQNLPAFGCAQFVNSSCGNGIGNFLEDGRVPLFIFPGGLQIGPRGNQTNLFYQHNPSARADVTWNRGSHNIKFGGEWLWHNELGEWHQTDRGNYQMSAVPANITQLFPAAAWNNPAAWNYTALQPLAISFQQGFHPTWLVPLAHTLWGVWFGDTWRINPKLTLNYGLRWDLDYGIFSPANVSTRTIMINNGLTTGNYGPTIPNNDWTDFGPRVGFAYDLSGAGTMVIRGGSGVYYSQTANNGSDNLSLYNNMISGQWFNHGQPDFMVNPRGGVTNAQMLACNVPANCTVPLPAQTETSFAPGYKNEYTWQTSVGFQKQLGAVTGLDVDLIGWHWYNDRIQTDPNTFYDPVTGYSKSPAVAGRPNPSYANIIYYTSNGYRNYLAMPTALTRRMSNKLQAGVNYTLMFFYNDTSGANNGGSPNNNYNPIAGEYARSLEFQRHTLRSYAIYQLPWRFTLSGTFFYGSGNPVQTVIGTVPFGIPGNNRYNSLAPITVASGLLDRWDGPATICTGCVIPRNALIGLPVYRLDLRANKEVPVGGRAKVALIAEVFNVFNHANYGSYVTQVNTATFGNPVANTGNGYAPRRGQLAVHLTF